MGRKVLVCCCSLFAMSFSGCVYALHPHSAPSKQVLQINAKEPARYSVIVDGGQQSQHYPVPSSGRVAFEVPQLPRGCDVYLFGFIKVADHRPEDIKAIHVYRDGQLVCRLSLHELVKLPADSDGVPTLTPSS
jgi:hypothetical protein